MLFVERHRGELTKKVRNSYMDCWKREERRSSLWRLRLEIVMDLSSDSPRDDDKLHLFSLTQHSFNSNCYRHVCATCFGKYLWHPQACQYENLTKVDTISIQVSLQYQQIWSRSNIWNINSSTLRDRSFNNTPFAKYILELYLGSSW